MIHKIRIRLRWLRFRKHWERQRDHENAEFFRELAKYVRTKGISVYGPDLIPRPWKG